MEITALLETRKEEFAALKIEIEGLIKDLQEEVQVKNKEIQDKNEYILGKRVALTALDKTIIDLESLS